jgi:hypothetical protein
MLVKSTPPLPLRALSAFALTSLSPVEARSSSSATRCFGVARDDGDDDEDGDEDGGKVEREGDDAEEGKKPGDAAVAETKQQKIPATENDDGTNSLTFRNTKHFITLRYIFQRNLR